MRFTLGLLAAVVFLLVLVVVTGSEGRHIPHPHRHPDRLPSAGDVISFVRDLLNYRQHHDYHKYIFKKREIDSFEDYDEYSFIVILIVLHLYKKINALFNNLRIWRHH